MGNNESRHCNGVDNERRLVIVGKSGSGKSATGNTILQKRVFNSKVSQASVTKKCKRGETSYLINKKKGLLLVIDTPGFFDTDVANDECQNEIAKCIGISSPGPHAILYVVSLSTRFTEEEEKSAEQFLCLFGDKVTNFLIIVFTHGDNFTENDSVEHTLKNAPNALKNLLDKCRGRYVVINNKTRDRGKKKLQIKQLFEVIEKMIEKGGKYHNSEIYVQTEDILLKRIEQLKKNKPVNPSKLREDVRDEIENDGGILYKIQELLTRFTRDMITHAAETSGLTRVMNGFANWMGW